MFTGLVEEIGTIVSIASRGNGAAIRIGCARILEGMKTGDSVSIDGACQTVEQFDDNGFSVFASHVTMSVTTFQKNKHGDRVNLERALLPTSRLGGHIVQGHIDGRGRVKETRRDAEGLYIAITADQSIMRHIAAKGSVAVNGVSLTVVAEYGDSFDLYLIPETLDRTTLPLLRAGDEVNIETDIFAKYCEKLMSGNDPDVRIMKALGENGFL
jgi:riboflavin synthase